MVKKEEEKGFEIANQMQQKRPKRG